MLKRSLKAILSVMPVLFPLPASAHVKWFLSESEAKLLAQPKPDLFLHLRWDNGIPVLVAGLLLYIAQQLNRRWAGAPFNKKLATAAVALDPYIQWFMGIFTGLVLLYCAHSMTFFVPNLHLHNCCRWIAATEACIGVGFVFGIMARPAAAAMLFLLAYSLVKFPLNDCADLLPLYGIALYVLIAGRGKYSLDHLLGVSASSSPAVCEISTAVLRVAVGLGLLSLGLDEKLVNPQLALNLLQQHPSLNFMHFFGMGNDMFVLLSGLVEVCLGICLTLGIFPRMAILFLGALFVATTAIFGNTEFVCHMPYYAIFLAVFSRGANISASAARWRSVVALQPARMKAALTFAKP